MNRRFMRRQILELPVTKFSAEDAQFAAGPADNALVNRWCVTTGAASKLEITISELLVP